MNLKMRLSMTFNMESGAGGVEGRFQVVGISVWVSRSVWDGAAHFYDLLRPDFGCRPDLVSGSESRLCLGVTNWHKSPDQTLRGL